MHGHTRLLAALILLSATLSPTPTLAQTVPVQIPSSDRTPASDFIGTTWTWLRSDYADGSSAVATDPSRYTVQFLGDSTVAIGADCNRVVGTYSRRPGQLSIQLLATTLAACLGESQADTFLADLSRVETYVMQGDNLALNLQADAGNMLLQPQTGPTGLGSRPLPTGVPWRIRSYNNGREAVVTVVAASQAGATFRDDGTVSGDTGCNTFTGTYTTSGSQVAIGPLATTRRACLSDELSAQEQAILAAFQATTSFELLGDQMTLRSADGATQMTLLRPLN